MVSYLMYHTRRIILVIPYFWYRAWYNTCGIILGVSYFLYHTCGIILSLAVSYLKYPTGDYGGSVVVWWPGMYGGMVWYGVPWCGSVEVWWCGSVVVW